MEIRVKKVGNYFLLHEDELLTLREKIQEDILAFASCTDDEKLFFTDEVLGNLCQIVVDQFFNTCEKHQ